jgi:hypothetical protein
MGVYIAEMVYVYCSCRHDVMLPMFVTIGVVGAIYSCECIIADSG